MLSDLYIELDRLNKGNYVEFTPYYPEKHKGRALELMGVVPIGTFCYICENKATHDCNNHRVCISCFNKLNKATQDKRSQMYKNDQLFYYDGGIWLSKKHSGRLDLSYTFRYSSLNSEEMLKITFLGQNERIGEVSCVSCNEELDWPCGGNRNSCCFEDSYACIGCSKRARLYFDLKPITYIFLKQIFTEESNLAKYVVLYYFKIKLRNCTLLRS